MKRTVLIVSLALMAASASAQTTAKPATGSSTAMKASTAAKPAAAAATKLPAGVPRVRGNVKSAFTLKYEDITVGTGAAAEPNKVYKVLYTGYLGANGRPDDGHKFDSSDDHRQPVKDKDGKPVMGDDGKPKLGDPQPITFPQGFGRLIPGFDQGFEGMKVGGKRRLFIPWQLAYGAKGRPGPDPAHPGIPPKADLIFDIQLVDQSDMPPQQARPGGMGMRPMPGGVPPHPGTAPAAAASPAGSTVTAPAAQGSATPASNPAPAATPAPSAQPAPSSTPAQPQSK
jgi:peptidylprolyl isomerase